MFQLLIVMPWCSESCSADSTIYFNQDGGGGGGGGVCLGVDVSQSFGVVAGERTLSFLFFFSPPSPLYVFFFFLPPHTRNTLRWIGSGGEVAVGNTQRQATLFGELF